jgi:hypothetical protein
MITIAPQRRAVHGATRKNIDLRSVLSQKNNGASLQSERRCKSC